LAGVADSSHANGIRDGDKERSIWWLRWEIDISIETEYRGVLASLGWKYLRFILVVKAAQKLWKTF